MVLAVNKIDLVSYRQDVFDRIEAEFRQFAETLYFAATITAIPLSACHGDNHSARSTNTQWYRGPTLLTHLKRANVADGEADQPFRMPVLWVNCPHLDFRGFAGMVASGRIRADERIVVAGSGRETTVARIVAPSDDVASAEAGDAVTLVLADEVDVAHATSSCRHRLSL